MLIKIIYYISLISLNGYNKNFERTLEILNKKIHTSLIDQYHKTSFRVESNNIILEITSVKHYKLIRGLYLKINK